MQRRGAGYARAHPPVNEYGGNWGLMKLGGPLVWEQGAS